MKMHELPSTKAKSKKRLGRGYGSGRGGHTAGRGTKGQKARSKVPAYFVGTSWVWFKRLPFIRGKSRFSSLRPSVTIKLQELSKLKSGTVVDANSLYQAGLIKKNELRNAKIKVVGSGPIDKKLSLAVSASEAARKAIEQAGGDIRASNN